MTRILQLLLLLATVPLSTFALDQKSMKNVKSSLVSIATSGWKGTGIIIKDDGKVLTDSACLGKGTINCIIEPGNGHSPIWTEAEVIGKHSDYPLAYLQLKLKDSQQDILKRIKTNRGPVERGQRCTLLSKSYVMEGESVMTAKSLIDSPNFLVSENDYMKVKLSGLYTSGAALVDDSGQLVGIAVQKIIGSRKKQCAVINIQSIKPSQFITDKSSQAEAQRSHSTGVSRSKKITSDAYPKGTASQSTSTDKVSKENAIIKTAIVSISIGLAGIVLFVGGIWMLIRAASVSVAWLLLVLFVPFGTPAFVILNWDKAKDPFLCQLMGIPIALCSFLAVLF